MTTEESADDAVLDDVFSSSRDRGADSAASMEKAEPDVEAPKASEPDASKQEAEPADAKPKGYRDPDSGRFVPLEELKTEREKRQEAQKARDEEARLRKEAEENARRYEHEARQRAYEFQQLQARLQAAQNPPPAPPDPVTDPEGAFAHMSNTIQMQMLNQSLNMSEMMARNKHGDQVVTAATKAAAELGIAGQFVQMPDAYEKLVQWHKRKLALDRVGDDPDTFEKSIRESERQKVLEELKTGKVQFGGPQSSQAPPRLPGALIDATASGPQGAQPITDEAMMSSVFASDRRRR